MPAARVSRAPVVVVVGFFAIAIVLVLIGAQRSSEAPPEVDIASAGTPEAPRDVNIIMRDYRFDPTPVVLVPGETVSLTIINGGLVEHELTLGDDDVQAAWTASSPSVSSCSTRPPFSTRRRTVSPATSTTGVGSKR